MKRIIINTMRPRSSCHRKVRLSVRVYSLEKSAIELAASHSGLVLSDYVRQCCLGKEIKERFSEEELGLYHLLVEYRNNFSRISNLIKEKQDFSSPLKELIDQLDKQLKKFTT